MELVFRPVTGYAVAGSNGSTLFFPSSERAPTLTKTDASGSLQWNKTFEATGLVFTNSLLQTKDGGLLLSGWNIVDAGNGTFVRSGWLIKTDIRGNVEWNQTFNLPLETCHTIQVTDGSYVSVGGMYNNFNGYDSVLVRSRWKGQFVVDQNDWGQRHWL
jgi:hypothetical protein